MSESQESGLSFKDRLKMFEQLSKSKESTESLANKVLQAKNNKSRATESSHGRPSLTSSTPTQQNPTQSPLQPQTASSQPPSQLNPPEEVKFLSVKDRIRAFSNPHQATQPAPVTMPVSKSPKSSNNSPSKPAPKPDSPPPPTKTETPPFPIVEETIPPNLIHNTKSKVSAPPAFARKQTESDADLFLYPRKSIIVANLSEFLSRPRPPPEEFFEKIPCASSIDNYDMVSIQLSKPLKHRSSASKPTFTDFP